MNTSSDTMEVMPLKKKIDWYWVCQRAACKHEWLAKDINVEPKRCARCKRLDWNRKTKPIGRPKKDEGRKGDPRAKKRR